MDWKKIIKEETENSKMTTFQSFEDNKKTYPYVILPFESRMSVDFQKAMIIALKQLLKDELKEATCVILAEAKAFLIAPFVTALNKDIVLIRKRDYKLPNQIIVKQEKAYKTKEKEDILCCVGLKSEDRPLLIDDMVSSGKTTLGLIKAIESCGIRLAGVATFYERGEGIKEIEKETAHKVKAVARLEIENNKPKCILYDF